MGTNNVIFLEATNGLMSREENSPTESRERDPVNGEIKYGTQMTVRESQAAVFFYNGKAYDDYGINL